MESSVVKMIKLKNTHIRDGSGEDQHSGLGKDRHLANFTTFTPEEGHRRDGI